MEGYTRIFSKKCPRRLRQNRFCRLSLPPANTTYFLPPLTKGRNGASNRRVIRYMNESPSFHRVRLTGLLRAVIERNFIRIFLHFLPSAFLRHLLFYRAHVVWHFLSELPLIAVLNKLRQRHLPGLLLVIRHTSQLLRIHAEFPCHLHVRVRQMMALSNAILDM